VKSTLSPHRIVTYAPDMVSSISERDFATAEYAQAAFDRMAREEAKSGLYAKLFLNGKFVVSISACAETE
jgi:hypothetical protein